MKNDHQIVVAETVDKVCQELCRFSYGEGEKKCLWRETHEGECPLEKMLKEFGLE